MRRLAMLLLTGLVLAPQPQVPEWRRLESVDKMDDSKQIFLALDAMAEVDGQRPALFIGCKVSARPKEPLVSVYTGKALEVGHYGSEHNLMRIRFDEEPAEATFWREFGTLRGFSHDPMFYDGKWHTVAFEAMRKCQTDRTDLASLLQQRDCTAEELQKGENQVKAHLAREDPVAARAELRFIRRIGAARRFMVEYTPYLESPRVAEFHPAGLKELLPAITRDCGWDIFGDDDAASVKPR